MNLTALSIPATGPSANLLFHNWDYLQRVQFQGLRTDVLGASNGYCFFCGNTTASQVDHFFPRSKFPQYSIFSVNLVPACYRCNNKKRARYQSPSGARLYLHPYLDPELPGQYLTASVSVSETVIVMFDVAQAASMPDWQYEVLSSHFNDLSLADLYTDESIQLLGEHLGAFYAYFRSGGAGAVAEYLLLDAQSSASFYGANHWKPVLLYALAASGPFCDRGFEVLGPEDPVRL